MAEKAEKIEKFITIQQRTITTRDYETNDEIISKFYPRKEAIERIAKELRKKLFKNEGPTQKIKENGLEKAYYAYVDFSCTYIAEAALNALLEGK